MSSQRTLFRRRACSRSAQRVLGAAAAAGLVGFFGLMAGCAVPPAAETGADGAAAAAPGPSAATTALANETTAAPAQRPVAGPGVPAPAFGIEFLDTRLSAAGSMVDLRYRVLDPDKAVPLLDRKVRPVLVHVESGRRYYVPQPPIVGALRQTMRGNQAPQPGRTYFMLFANPDRVLKTGDTLALFVGDQRVGEFRILQ